MNQNSTELAMQDATRIAEQMNGQPLYTYPQNRRHLAIQEVETHNLRGDNRTAYIQTFLETWQTWQRHYDIAHLGFISFHVLSYIIREGRAGREVPTSEAVDYCIAHPHTSWPAPLDFATREEIIDGVDRRIPTLFIGIYTTPTKNATVIPYTSDYKVASLDGTLVEFWGEAIAAEGRIVEVAWKNGTVTKEPFWSLISLTSIDRLKLDEE